MAITCCPHESSLTGIILHATLFFEQLYNPSVPLRCRIHKRCPSTSILAPPHVKVVSDCTDITTVSGVYESCPP
eukprot:XP_001708397.1 Hypothetical protein GL50803_94861 [Giardia lamblia ATCC 50803]